MDLKVVLPMFVPLALAAAGAVVRFVPPELWLKAGERVGNGLYAKEINLSGDENRALAKAAGFYKLFGTTFMVTGSAIALINYLTFLFDS